MKKSTIAFCLFLFSLNIFGQVKLENSSKEFAPPVHHRGEACISIVAPNVLLNSSSETYIGGGIKMRMFISKRFSFDSDLIFGHNYTRFGIGIMGLPLWYLGPDFGYDPETEYRPLSDLLFTGLIMVLSAEHISYHIPVQNNTDISPYISLLRFKLLNGIENPGDPSTSDNTTNFAFGIEFNRYIKRFVLSPYIDYEVAYSGGSHGFNIGFSLGYCFEK